jgi:uncharacterized protein DUF6308
VSPEPARLGLTATGRRLELRLPKGAVQLTPVQLRAALQGARDATGLYDQVATDPQRVALVDLAIPTLLGARVDFQALAEIEPRQGLAGLRARLDRAGTLLRELPLDVDLWDWPGAPDNARRLSELYGACALPGFGPSQVTKLLHRKRPRLLPIVDETCVWPAWSRIDPAVWTVDELVRITFAIGAALRRQAEAVLDLRRLAGETGPPLAGLSTLRLYDLLTWTGAEGAGSG